MTEEQIERSVQRRFDTLDAIFMARDSTMTQPQYDDLAQKIHAWAENELRFVTRNSM